MKGEGIYANCACRNALVLYYGNNLQKSLISLALWVAFPFAFAVRIFALRYPGIDTMLFIGSFCVIYLALNVTLYKKYSF